MKRILMSAVAGTLLLNAGAAFAGDCDLQTADASIQAAIDAIKNAGPYGKAGGHDAKAIKHLEDARKETAQGCKVFNKNKK